MIQIRIHNLQMVRIWCIIENSRVKENKEKRRVNCILNKKLKFYTKEMLKVFNLSLIALVFMIAILFMKYKPTYAVSIAGEEVGFVQSKEALQEVLQTNIEKLENDQAQNIEKVTLEAKPEFTLKLVNKAEETNEQEILVAMQKEMKITYHYVEIQLDGNTIETVNQKSEAEELIGTIKQDHPEINLSLAEKTTENIEEIKTSSIEVAKTTLLAQVGEKEQKEEQIKREQGIANVNGIQLATLPIKGTITSRYGVNSRIRVSTHTGLDIAATTGTPIKVVAEGTVTCASYSGSYGNLVKVSHGNGVETWYGHTSKMYVKVGQKVTAGEVIAAVGSTGNSTGPHLHFEIRINGNHVNPQQYVY